MTYCISWVIFGCISSCSNNNTNFNKTYIFAYGNLYSYSERQCMKWCVCMHTIILYIYFYIAYYTKSY